MRRTLFAICCLFIVTFTCDQVLGYWLQTFGTGDNPPVLQDIPGPPETIFDIASTADGGAIATGTNITGTKYRFWVVKLNGDGEIEWQKYFDQGAGFAVSQTEDGGYVAAGIYWDPTNLADESSLISGSTGQGWLWVIRLGPSGETLWYRILGQTSLTEYGYHNAMRMNYKIINLTVGTDDMIYVSWVKLIDGEGVYENNNWRLIKFDDSGSILWDNTYGADLTGSRVFGLLRTNDGGVIGTGVTWKDNSWDLWLIKVIEDGTIDWQRAYGEAATYESGHAIAEIVDDQGIMQGYMVGGAGFGSNVITQAFDWQPWLLRVDTNGELQWQKRIQLYDVQSPMGTYGEVTDIETVQEGRFLVSVNASEQRDPLVIHHNYSSAYLLDVQEGGVLNGAGEVSELNIFRLYALSRTVSGALLAAGLTPMSNESGLSALAMKADEAGAPRGCNTNVIIDADLIATEASSWQPEAFATAESATMIDPAILAIANGRAESQIICRSETNLKFHQQTDTPDPVGVGETVTYTIKLENLGPADATGVMVNGFVTSGENLFVGWSGDLSVDGMNYTCRVGDLPVGGTETFSIVVTTTEKGIMESRATVTSDLYDPWPDNNETFEDTTVSPPGLSLDIQDNPDPTCLGCGLSYIVKVTNFSTIDATGVVLTDTLPEGFDPLVYDCSRGDALISGSVVTCDIGDLLAGQGATLTLGGTVTTAGTGVLVNTAEVTANGVDVLPQHTDTEETFVQYPDLSVEISDWSDPVQVGYYLIYSVTATNHSNFPAHDVVVTDTLPPDTELVSCTVSQGNWYAGSGTVTADFGSLNGESNARMTLVVKTLSEGIIVNTAEITNSLGEDNNLADNGDTESTEITVWSKQDLGRFGGEDQRKVSLATDESGNIYVAFIYGDGHLNLFDNRMGTWQITTFGDSITDAAMTVDDNGYVHMAYVEKVVSLYNEKYYLKYIHNKNGQWSLPHNCDWAHYYPIKSLDIVVKLEPEELIFISCIAHALNDSVSYLNYFKSHPTATNGFVQDWWPAFWSVAMAVDHSPYDHGQPHFSYFSSDVLNDESGVFGIGYFTRRDLNMEEIVDPGWGCASCEVCYTDIALDSQYNPHIVYAGQENDTGFEHYWHATKTSDSWERTRLAEGYNYSGGCAIAIDDTDGVHTVVYDVSDSNGKIAYISKKDNGWETTNIYARDNGRIPLLVPNIVIDANQTAHIAFLDDQSHLQIHSNRLSLDADQDAIPDIEEMGTDGTDPAWDGNGDGTPDFQQPNVTSLKCWNKSGYVTLAVPEGMILTDVQAVPNPSPLDAPTGADFSYGFFSFKVLGIEAGASVPVTLILPAGGKVLSYYKFGASPGNKEKHWYAFEFDNVTGNGAAIEANVITLHLTDGQRGDADLDDNGVIVEPGGPSVVLPPDGGIGDVDNSGAVDLRDAVILLKLLCGIGADSDLYTTADVNNDNRLGMEEAIYTLQVISGQR